MNEKELLEKIQGLIAESHKGSITKEELDAKVAAINKQLEVLNNKADNHAEVKSLKDSVDALIQATADNAAAIKAMTESSKGNQENKPASLKDALMDAVLEAAKNVPSLVSKTTEGGREKISIRDYFLKLGN